VLLVPVADVALFAPGLFAATLAAPLPAMLLAVFFAAASAPALVTPAFLTTVPVLPSLDSLVALILRPARVPGRDAGALEVLCAAVRRAWPFAAVVAEVAPAFVAVVTFLVPAVRAAFDFSTMLERTLVAALVERPVPVAFRGDPGRAM
jgi:hypothetical protein